MVALVAELEVPEHAARSVSAHETMTAGRRRGTRLQWAGKVDLAVALVMAMVRSLVRAMTYGRAPTAGGRLR